MANDGFALSPMSANGTLPSESDYNAISDAFMETARGRWFLKEYARRNRNADTAVVLEAVARIEAGIAAQRRQGPVTGLASAMSAIRTIIDDAKTEAAMAAEQLSLDETFAPTRKAVRVIQEVSWRLREIGYDSRICDILESQAKLIDANHEATAIRGSHEAILSAFDLIGRQINELADNALTVVSEMAAPADLAEARLAREKGPAHPAAENVVSLGVKPQASSSLSAPETLANPQHTGLSEAAITVAIEPDNAEPDNAEPDNARLATGAAIDPTAATPGARMAAADSASEPHAGSATETPAATPSTHERSLGEALLARGMVQTNAHTAKLNPLASIRRMSQAEKIAFFS